MEIISLVMVVAIWTLFVLSIIGFGVSLILSFPKVRQATFEAWYSASSQLETSRTEIRRSLFEYSMSRLILVGDRRVSIWKTIAFGAVGAALFCWGTLEEGEFQFASFLYVLPMHCIFEYLTLTLFVLIYQSTWVWSLSSRVMVATFVPVLAAILISILFGLLFDFVPFEFVRGPFGALVTTHGFGMAGLYILEMIDAVRSGMIGLVPSEVIVNMVPVFASIAPSCIGAIVWLAVIFVYKSRATLRIMQALTDRMSFYAPGVILAGSLALLGAATALMEAYNFSG